MSLKNLKDMTTGHNRTFKDYYRGVSSWQSPWDDPNLMDVRPFIVTTTEAFFFGGELYTLHYTNGMLLPF